MKLSFPFIVFCVAMVIAIITVVVITAIQIFKIRKDSSRILESIEQKGYKWADKPWGHIKTYILTKEEPVKIVGHLPDGKQIYETESHKRFLSSPGNKYKKVFIDAIGNAHERIENYMVVNSNNLIVPDDDYYIINNPEEAKDYVKFFTALNMYNSWDKSNPNAYSYIMLAGNAPYHQETIKAKALSK